MQRFLYHGVRVRWRDGRVEMLRYDTEQQARAAARYQFVENWQETRSAIYVGRRVHWRGLLRLLSG